MLTSSDVMPKLTNGNVTPVSGITARLPATVTASWHSASTTQATQSQLTNAWSSLPMRPARRDEARLAARRRDRGGGSSRCSQTAHPSVSAHAAVQPNAPTSAVNV